MQFLVALQTDGHTFFLQSPHHTNCNGIEHSVVGQINTGHHQRNIFP